MPNKLFFLMNPVSGTKDKQRIKTVICDYLFDRNILFEFFPTNASGNYSLLEEKIKAEGIRDIIIIGGDGTISQAANALRHLNLNFGLIPNGSGNGLALAAGISREPVKALETVLNGKPSCIDAFYINGHFSCMLSGIGFDAKVAHDFSKMKKRGFMTYVKVSMKNFFSAKEYPFLLKIDGKEIDTEAYFISIANSNQFGNNFTIAPKASISDGLLDIIVVQKMNKLQVLLSIIHQLKYGDVQEGIFKRHGILYYQVETLDIMNPALAPLHIDGDPHETAPEFHITIIPSAFSLILPPF
jgi:YegS/Rv2252/BmrU family lipid kinase